ncbi:MAG: chemotaxis protein CheB [Deltaproteobacteria bacterium]|nr:chemotaxis protein CheB [Deltaproteobacteria bacterium]
MIKIAILDDSTTARTALRRALEADSEILVVGEAQNGRELYRLIDRFQPDLLCIDVYLEKENGLDVAAYVMTHAPTPIVLVTATNPTDSRLVFKSMQCGVLDVFAKLPAANRPEYESLRANLIGTLKALARVPVFRGRRNRAASGSLLADFRNRNQPAQDDGAPARISERSINSRTPDMVLIGASTGGPPVIQKMLQKLPAAFPAPIVIVQHISRGFAAGFAQWLVQGIPLKGHLVEEETPINPGTVYVAPDDKHIQFISPRRLRPVTPLTTDNICPSIDMLFQSASQMKSCYCAAVLLTGMGKDGAQGLTDLYSIGNYTIAQSPESCAVSSMPQTAIEQGGVTEVLAPEKIADKLMALTGEK